MEGKRKRVMGLSEIIEHSEPIMDLEELQKSSNPVRWITDIKGTYYCLLRQFERLLRLCEEQDIIIIKTEITQERFPDEKSRPLYRIIIDGYQR